MEYEFEHDIIEVVAARPPGARDPKAPLEMPTEEPQEETEE